jgi:hypothetical protein
MKMEVEELNGILMIVGEKSMCRRMSITNMVMKVTLKSMSNRMGVQLEVPVVCLAVRESCAVFRHVKML